MYSEFSGSDKFLNNDAADTFIQSLAGLVNQSDVQSMIRSQKQMLQRFEKTNEMLVNCNALSQSRLRSVNDEFKKHVKFLTEMKKDLDYIFRKVRIVKQKLSKQYSLTYLDSNDHCSTGNSAGVTVIDAQKEECDLDLKNSCTINTHGYWLKKKIETTVEYVQMDEAVENEKPIENELIKKVCSLEITNPNDSSDCTSEDTG